MERSNPQKRSSWFIVLLLLVIILGYVFYFFVYVRGAEERLYNKGEFVLEDVISNVHELDKHYQQSAERRFNSSMVHFVLKQLISEQPKCIEDPSNFTEPGNNDESRPRGKDPTKKEKEESIYNKDRVPKDTPRIQRDNRTICKRRADLLEQLNESMDTGSSEWRDLTYFAKYSSFDTVLANGLFDRKLLSRISEIDSTFLFYGFKLDYDLTQEIKRILRENNCLDPSWETWEEWEVDWELEWLLPSKIIEGTAIELGAVMNQALRTDFFENVLLFDSEHIYYQHIKERVSEPVNIDTLKYLAGEYDAGVTILDVPISGRSKKMFFKPFYLNEKQYFIAGTRDLSEFTMETRGLNYLFIMFITAIFLVLLSVAPMVKLYVINAYERLSSSNVIMSAIGFLIGLYAIPTILATFVNYEFVEHYRNNSIVDFSATLQKTIVDELHQHYDLLASIKGSTDQPKMDKLIDEDKATVSQIQAEVNNALMYNYNELIFISEDGIPFPMISNTVKRRVRSLLPSLKQRQYFSAFSTHKDYKWNNDINRVGSFFVGSQFSKTKNQHESSVSIQIEGLKNRNTNKDHKVLAVTGSPNSLVDAVLPHGYGYYVIDEVGNVLFSSDKNDQFHENLEREAEPRSAMISNIRYGQSESFEMHYHGRHLLAHITPIDEIVHAGQGERGYPLYLLTWYDKALVVGINGNSALQASIICTTGWLLLVALMVILQLMHRSDSRLKRRVNAYRWLFPFSSSRSGYELGTFVYSVQAALLIIYAASVGPQLSISWLFLFELVLFTSAFNMKCIKFKSAFQFRKDKAYVRVLSIIATILAFIIIYRSPIHNYREWNLYQFAAHLALFISLVMHLLLLWVPVVFELFRDLAARSKIIIAKALKVFAILRNRSYESTTQRTIWWYRRFLISWMLCIAVIPAIIAFKVSYLTEAIILTEHGNVMENAKLNEAKESFAINYSSRESIRASARSDSVSANYKKYKDALNTGGHNTASISANDHKLRDRFRQIEHAYHGSEYHEFSDLPGVEEHDLVYKDVKVPSAFYVRSNLWIGLTLALGLFMFLIYMVFPGILNRLFTWRLSSDLEIAEKNKRAGSALHKFMHQVGQMHADARAAYLTSMPSVNIETWLDKNSDLVKNSTEALDVVRLSEHAERERIEQSGSKAPVLLTELTIDLHKASSLVEKMNTVQKVLNQDRPAIFVHSNLSIGQFLMYLSKQASENVVNSGDQTWIDLTVKVERLFGEMRAFVIQMQPEPFQPLIPLACHFEFAYGADPDKALDTISEDDWAKIGSAEQRDRMRESIILKAQRHLKPFYLSIWNALDKRERYVVYDICEDGFINLANKVTVYLLVDKGILRLQNESIVPFNESFQNFVLTNIRPEEALEIEQLARTKGSWGMIRLALLICALALITFLFLINQSSLDKAVALVTGGVTLLSVAGRLFGSFNLSGMASIFQRGGK